MTDYLKSFCKKLVKGDLLEIEDFFSVCNVLGLGDGLIHSSERLRDFFYICGLHSDPAKDYKMNSSKDLQ